MMMVAAGGRTDLRVQGRLNHIVVQASPHPFRLCLDCFKISNTFDLDDLLMNQRHPLDDDVPDASCFLYVLVNTAC